MLLINTPFPIMPIQQLASLVAAPLQTHLAKRSGSKNVSSFTRKGNRVVEELEEAPLALAPDRSMKRLLLLRVLFICCRSPIMGWTCAGWRKLHVLLRRVTPFL